MSLTPVVSVIMPVYNAERYLAEAVESILAQTFRDFEFIIIDDGSTDGSLPILRRYADRDCRISLISRPNTGYVVALNEMLCLARGEFLARMDADDIALPDRLARQVAYLKENSDCVCVGTGYVLMDAAGRTLVRRRPITGHAEIEALLLAGCTCIPHPSVIMRAAAVRRAGGYRDAFCPAEDLDLYLRLGEIGHLQNLPDTLLRYRIHDASVSAGRAAEQHAKQRAAAGDAWRRRGITGEFRPQEPWRPGPARSSRQAFILKHGWWALQSGEMRTAFLYGLKAIRLLPTHPGGWRLGVTALRDMLRGRR